MITLGIMIVDGPKIGNQQKIFSARELVSIIILIINGTNKKIPIPVQVSIFDHAYCGAKEPFFKKTYLDMYMGTEPNSAIEIQSLLEATELMNGNFYNDVIMT